MPPIVQSPSFEFNLAPLFEDQGIPLAVMGILVVFLALLLVAVFILLLPHVIARIAPPQQQQLPKPLAAEGELAEETVVVIAAAVAAVIDAPHRIVKIRGLTPEDLGWSLEGRMQHHHSHQFQRRNHR